DDWISAHHEYDWQIGRSPLGCKSRRCSVRRYYEGHAPLHEIGGKDRQLIVLAFRPAIFDSDILSLNITGFFQAQLKCGDQLASGFQRCWIDETNCWDGSLLSLGIYRPHGHCATKHDGKSATAYHL